MVSRRFLHNLLTFWFIHPLYLAFNFLAALMFYIGVDFQALQLQQ